MTIKKFLVIKDIEVQNANAISSYCTIGVPAITAFGGALHALQRKLNADSNYIDIKFTSFAVLVKNIDLQVCKQGYTTAIIATANPSVLANSTGDIKRPAFIEEARAHLKLTLVIDIETATELADENQFCNTIKHLLQTMKLASGDILSVGSTCINYVNEADDKSYNTFINSIMPAYALIERKDLMIQSTENGTNTIDALLDSLAVYNNCEKITTTETTANSTEDFKIKWKSKRQNSGWIVPIAVGFQGISPLAEAKNTRDPSIPHRFAEAVVTLGEFKMPHKCESINTMFWQYNYDAENNLYVYIQPEQQEQDDYFE